MPPFSFKNYFSHFSVRTGIFQICVPLENFHPSIKAVGGGRVLVIITSGWRWAVSIFCKHRIMKCVTRRIGKIIIFLPPKMSMSGAGCREAEVRLLAAFRPSFSSSSRAYCRWSSPFLMRCSSIWNYAFFLLSAFRRDEFSSGMPNTNPHFISRALFSSTPPQAGYLQTCHPIMWVNLPVKWKEGEASSQKIWADEPYITHAKNMQLIEMEKRKVNCA